MRQGKPMNIFKNDEKGYLAWHTDHPNSFVLNQFGGTNAAYNVLHHSDCVFLWRDVDKDSRTLVEKWCSPSESELAEQANSVLGSQMWKRCGVCFRSTKADREARDTTQTSEPDKAQLEESVWIPGEPAVWVGSGEKQWKQKVTAALQESMPAEHPQWIHCELRLLEERLYEKDIDNMLTPLLASARDAGWVERGFARLGSVTARKVAVAGDSEVGANITAHANPAKVVDDKPGVLVETDLVKLDADAVKWALYEKAFQLFEGDPDLRFPPICPLSLDIRVTIDDEQRRKSIQAFLKPCIDGLEPILGHPDNLLPEPRAQLKRRLAPQDEMILSLDFHVRGGSSNRVSALIRSQESLSDYS